MLETSNITIIYYTANTISDWFGNNMREQLYDAAGHLPIICVSKKPMSFGDRNITTDLPRSHINIYKQALLGAWSAETKYIALCEDDVLYSPEHFKYRPSPGKFAYNMAAWAVYTWTNPPLFSWKNRRNLSGLICERDLFVQAMEERFAKYNDSVDLGIWSEPGKYERQLGVTVRETEGFFTNPPNIVFSHEEELSFAGLGTRKRLGEMRATAIPYWGTVEEVLEMYKP